ncbi:portal protein [Cronobacter phage vB_CsaM_GAP32]|uniref:Portal vertex protein of head n=1 Tax=Cronobacter phage vB_CsaM_GAP32 TaxID=1141136 RepID=K4F9K9_9CAUD|nr:portal protein [Cronobacter phage vB_CsaM_GAP32]AFC21695.1 portal vertex protein of head [Cronobacter phage vB_CsaM_GAP32]
MSSWKRHMTMGRSKISSTPQNNNPVQTSGAKTNFASYLPAVYTGLANRVDRYRQYDQMDQDPEIRTALNIIADFCTQSTKDFGLPFQIQYKDEMGDSEVTTLEDRLESWADQNQFKIRIYDIIRGILKYGDQFFVRDPETFEWYWVNPMNVDKVVVNEATGKNPIIYYMRDISLNIRDKVMSNNNLGFDKQTYGAMPNSLSGAGNQYGSVGGAASGSTDNSNAFGTNGQLDVLPVAAEHVIHLSLNTGQDPFWPFGTSILENIFKVYKQKELLEDSIIIYRVQRAPERRVFKIDVGDMQPHQAMAYVERVKNDIHQRRIPSNKGGSTSLMDAAYNPLSILEDYFFPQTAEGRGSSVETLPGGDNLGQIDDLRYFNNKLIRGLQIPASYLPMGPDDGGVALFGDGATQAMASELRFNNECMRYQRIISRIFDEEFKRYMIKNGYNISASSFEVTFNPPMNFAANRKAEMDAKLIQTYMPLNDLKYFSKQFIMKKMGFEQDDIVENEKLWQQENPQAMANSQGVDAPGANAGLQSVGIESPNNPETDLGIDDDGNLQDADSEYKDQNGGDSGFDPNSLGNSF